MREIDVEIEGLAPLMMHSPKGMFVQEGSTRSTMKKVDPKEEAEMGSYRNKEGYLYIPVEAVRGCLLNGASFKKVGKYSAKSILAGNVRIEPMEILLGTKNYEIDIRTVVLSQGKKRNRIIRARPRLDEWKAKFKIIYNENFIGDPSIIKACLEDAGGRVGLLEYRPQTGGNYGIFKVTKFTVGK